MKTSLFFNAIHQLSLSLLACATLLLTWSACTDPPPIIEPGEDPIIDEASDYIGHYDMVEDDCHSSGHTIVISRIPPAEYQDHLDSPLANPRIYIQNLVDNVRSPIVAEWAGAAFVIIEQDYMLEQNPIQVSGRLYHDEGELTVSYQFKGTGKYAVCSGKFRKTG